jgi:single-stranded-DNA-specific exonuclease
MVQPLYNWRLPARPAIDRACLDLARERGISRRLMALLAARGVTTAAELASFLAPVEDEINDPSLLPDAGAALDRVARARAGHERVLVYGDFDADGLSGLAVLVLALRHLGLDATPYVPERLGDGHGLSVRAIELAAAEGRSLIVTADCGTSSEPEIALARERGIDVLVTDHHHAPVVPPSAVAVVNPQRSDSVYPDRRLTGAGVAWKVAHLLLRAEGAGKWPLPDSVSAMADLALIGTVADVAPVLGENRAIARLGLERLRTSPRPGLAALIARAGLDRERLALDDVGFAIAPRLNAAGRVGEAARAARLLLADDSGEAERLADEIDAANRERREITRTALAEARRALSLEPGGPEALDDDDGGADENGEGGPDGPTSPPAVPPPADLPVAILIRGEWPVGIVGLIAGKLAEEFGRPAIVATSLGDDGGTLRASCRSGNALNLAEALVECSDLLIRHGGHEAAAGFDIGAEQWPAFTERFLALAEARAIPAARPEVALDLVLRADSVDFAFVREIEALEPTGPGNPRPILGLTGLTVVRVKAANGGHTQLVLRRSKDVLDAIAFRRPDLRDALREGDRIDVAARASVRTFGGLETVQLEVIDVAGEGTQIQPPGPAGALSG